MVGFGKAAGRLATVVLVLGSVAGAGATPPELPRFVPRFVLLQLQYPQIVAVSAGSWLRLAGDEQRLLGLVGDLELGLGGATLALGPGVSSGGLTRYEKVWSLGLQGALHQTWPWWSPFLPEAATFAGAELFGAYFAVRCSAGALWPIRGAASPTLVLGCGLGLP
jgi:hypothetical protein